MAKLTAVARVCFREDDAGGRMTAGIMADGFTGRGQSAGMSQTAPRSCTMRGEAAEDASDWKEGQCPGYS